MRNLIYLTIMVGIFAGQVCLTADEKSPVQNREKSHSKPQEVIVKGKLIKNIKKGKSGEADTVTYYIKSKDYGSVEIPANVLDSGIDKVINSNVKMICIAKVNEAKGKNNIEVLEFIGFMD